MATRRIARTAGTFVRPSAAAAFAATLPLALALSAGLAVAQQAAPETAATASSSSAVLEQAQKLLDSGQPVAAKALLEKAFQADGRVHVGDDRNLTPSGLRTRAMAMLAEASRKSRGLEPMEASLQKSKLALDEGDIRTAERHAKAVQRSSTATPAQGQSATDLLKSIEQRRHDLEPIIPETLEQAVRDFDAGRYAQAKAGLMMVERSGVKLTGEQQGTLDKFQLQIVDLAEKQPELFVNSADMGLLQPGTIKRQDQPVTPPPAEKTPEKPATTPVAQPVNPPAARPAQPVAEPAPAQPAGDDAIRQAMQTEAASLLSQADKAFEERRLSEASGKYLRLRNEFKDYLTPAQAKHVNDRLAEARVIMGGGGQPRGEGLDVPKLRHDRALAEFNNDLDQAKRALDGGNVEQARTLVAKARLTVNSNKDAFADSELENLNNQASARLADIDKRQAEIVATDQKKRDEDVRKTAEEMANAQHSERERKIIELIDRARAYQSEMRYAEALQAVEQLLFLDPINPTGLLLKDVYFDILAYQKSAKVYNQKQEGYVANGLNNEEATIPIPDIMDYPADWPAISVRRGDGPAQFADSAQNRAVLAELGKQVIPTVSFADNSLQDVVTFVQNITRQNLDVDWQSLEQANIQKETPVSLNLTNVSAKALLDRVIEKISGSDRSTRADWTVNDGVVTIASEDKIRKHTSLMIYDIRDLLVEIPDYTDIPSIDLQQALQSSGGGGGGGGGGQSPFREDQGNDRQQRQRNSQQRTDDLISIITGNIDQEGWQENGGDTGRIQKLTNGGSLIITNTPKNHRAIAGLLAKLREARAMQINVETRFLLVNQNFFEQIGFDLDVYLNANSNVVSTAHAADRSIQPSDLFTNGRYNRTVTGQQGPNAATTTPAGTQLTQGLVNPNGWSPVGFQQDSLGLASALAPASDWSDKILGAAPALGIAGQFLDDVQVDFLVRATQADRRAVSLTAPRLTFTNGQTANIYVATQTAFVSNLTPVVGDSAVGFQPTVSVVTEGVTLLVEGTVTADRRYVTMNVDAGVARIDGFALQAVTAVTGGQLVNSRDTQSFIQLPKVTVTRVRTTVTVPDQGTILMGGQRLVTEFEIETGVPVLSKIPIINRFFTNRIESREESTLLILMKPTILIQNEEEERNYPGLMDSVRGGGGIGG